MLTVIFCILYINTTASSCNIPFYMLIISLCFAAIALTCSCSSYYDPFADCSQVYDGNTIPHYTNGYAWYSNEGDSTPYIQINFPMTYSIGGITVYHGCWSFEQCSSFDITFSDGNQESVSICRVNESIVLS